MLLDIEPCHRLNRPISVIVMFRIAICGELLKLDVGHMANSMAILMCLNMELNGLTLCIISLNHVLLYMLHMYSI
jgi:hypothetical protein